MPQFDLANASLSSTGLTKIKTAEKYIPFVYDDGYPIISETGVTYPDNDPKPPSATTNYISDFYGRVPYDPDFHKEIRGTLTIGYGTTFDGKPGKDNLFNQVYTDGISIGGTTFIFPVQFLEANATNSTGGFFKNESGTQITNSPIRLKYTGNDSTNSTKVFNATLADQLLQDKLAASVAKVKSVFNGSEDAFPYDNTLAQTHFDMMVAICFHQGQDGFEHSFFVNRYKLVDGTSVTTAANLTAYNNAAYALMWLAAVGHEGTYYWVKPQIDRRNNDINELLGTAGSRTFPTGLNPIVKPDWYQGAEIPIEYFESFKNADLGLDGSVGARNSTSRTVVSDETKTFFTPALDFHTGSLSALRQAGITTDFADFYTGNRSIYSSEPGSADFYKNDPLYQKYYSKFWQPNEKFYHGADVVGAPRTATAHGAVFASNPDSQTPGFIFGINEDGSGVSRLYLRSSLSQSTISSGTDTTIWDIADGKIIGTIDYGQWNHFAITRKGNVFRTFKNGTKVSEFTSPKSITRSTRDGTLKFSIGRSQGSDYFKGFIDGLRVTKGSALYTSNFTPSSTELSTTSTTGLYNGEHFVETVYSAINKVSEQLGTEYRVNTDGTSDAGLKEVLFEGHGTNEPPAIIVRDVSGEDPSISGLTPEQMTAQFDAEDYVSGVELLSQTQGSSQQADHAEAFDEDTPYRDLFGAKLERVQFVGETDIPNVQRQSRAEAYLNELKKIKKTLSLSLEAYEIQGDFKVGDMIFVYDPEIRFEDTEAKRIEDGRDSLFEVAYRGQIINPEKIRITGITYPVKDGYGVYLRKVASTQPYRVEYVDLTDYVQFETGNTQLDIGDLSKRIGDDLRFTSAVTGVTSGTRSTGVRKPRHPDTLVEGSLKLTSATVQDDLGRDNAIIFVEWEEPTDDAGNPIQNGLQYQIEWKATNTTGDYQSSFVNWSSSNDFTIEGLQLNTNYEVRVIAVLLNANTSEPATGTITSALDTNAPSKPAQASTIASGALRVQIVHNLARVKDDSGNVIGSPTNFTLQRDIDHLNVYASTSSGFSLATSTLKAQFKVGEIPCTASHIKHQIPAVGEIQMPNGSTHFFRFTAVDAAGNESEPSDEQSANGNLVATANISDAAISSAKIANLAVTDAKIATLSAGKITAGTISGQEIIVGTNTSDSAVIKSSNYSTGSAGWKIDSDGTVEFESGTFRGNLDGAGGTFSGNLSAAGGTFTGTVSANQVTGGTLDFSSVTAGNLDFSSLSVQAGDIVAEIAAGEITDSLIGGVSVGKLTAGSIVGNSITLGSGSNTSGSISSHNFSSGSTGFQIQYDGDAFFNSVTVNNPVITLNTNTGSSVPTSASSSALKIGTSTLFERSNKLFVSKPFVVFPDGDEDNPSLTISGDYDEMGFFVSNSTDAGGFSTFSASNGDDDIFSFTTLSDTFTVKGTLSVSGDTILVGNSLTVNGDSGNANEFIGKDSNGTLGYHSVATGSHTHNNFAGVNHNHNGFSSATHTHNNFASSGHGHNNFASNNHDHDSSYSGVNHNHNAFASAFHTHNNFANSTHNHSNMANLNYVNSQITAHRFDVAHSDERLKENISDVSLGLDFINRLQPRDFSWKSSYLDNEYSDEVSEDSKYKTFLSNTQQGFIAQEVQSAVFAETGSNSSFGGVKIGDVTDSDKTYSSDSDDFGRVDYNQFVAPLVKAVQQLSSKIDLLEARIDELENP